MRKYWHEDLKFCQMKQEKKKNTPGERWGHGFKTHWGLVKLFN